MSEASCETQAYSPHLKKVLNSYRTAAMTSLSGPNSCLGSWPASSKLMDYDHHHHQHGLKTKTLHQVLSSVKKNCAHTSTTTAATTTMSTSQPSQTPTPATQGSADYDPFLAPPPFPIQQLPILTAPDQSRSERSETILEGEVISCFVVGGEKRLCLPQILNSVLRDFSLQQINAVCDDLQIFCSRCNREQLEVLKVTGVLPFAAPSCGLITKTDAERLCSALLYRHPVVLAGSEKKKYSLKVYHECFGKCKGLYTPDDYSSPSALCIECLECHGHFSPQKFVCHAHKALEKRTCHWGFDSANWRAYVLVAKEQANLEQLQIKLDEMKNRYYDDYHGKYKRKQYTQEEKDLSKKAKYGPEESPVNAGYLPYVYDPMSAYWYPTIASQWSRVSAFRPWSPVVGKDGKPTLNQPMPQQAAFFRDNISQSLPPFLSHGPPVLLNPERVVPLSETERFERHYQPNVALAPPSAQQVPQKTCLTSTANVLMGNSPREKRIIPDDNDVKIMNPEIDMSTDTDETLSDSTISAESNDYQCEAVGSGNEKNTSEDNNKVDEIESLRKLMEANNIGAEPQQEIVREVEKLRKKYKIEAELAIKEKDALQRELDYLRMSKREKIREASEAKRHLRKQLQQVHEEHSAQLMEQMQVQEQLRSQLAAALSIKQETPEKIGRGKNIVEQVSPVEDIAAAEGKLMNEPSIKVEKERD